MVIKILEQINIPGQCRKYGLGLWQCPNFLFFLMGLFIIAASIASYTVGTAFLSDPTVVALIDILLTGVLFTIAVVIVRNFERVAEASRMKTEFVNVVSHQLRGPITNIRWISEFIDTEGVKVSKDKKAEYITNLKENIARVGELIDDLLIVSRLEENTLPIRKKDFSLSEIISETASRSSVFAEASRVKIKTKIAKNIPDIFFDPSLVKLVIENLVDNAIRYSKPGGTVEIKAEEITGEVRVEVKDGGVGIPDEDKKFIFQKFFRAENSLKDKTKGSGLGLYIAKEIIEAGDGKIGFDSQAGKGTRFFFTLPVKRHKR